MTSNNEDTDQAALSEQLEEKFDVPTAMTGLIAHVEAWKDAREIVKKEVETINVLRARLKEAGYAIALDEFDQGNMVAGAAVIQSITPDLAGPEPEPEPDEDEDDIEIEIIAPVPEKVANQQTEQIRKESMGPAPKAAPIPELTKESVSTGLDRAMAVGFANADKEAAANVIGPVF